MIQSSDIHEHLTSVLTGRLRYWGHWLALVPTLWVFLASSEAALLHPKLSVHRVDICDKQGLGEILSGVEVLIHLACGCIPQNSNDYPVSDVEINLASSLNMNCLSLVKSKVHIHFLWWYCLWYPSICPIMRSSN